VATQQLDGLGGEHAVRPTAVGDDLDALAHAAKLLLQLAKGNGYRPRDVALHKLLTRADVEHDDVPTRGAVDELVAAHRLEAVAGDEIVADDPVDLRQPRSGEASQSDGEEQNFIVGQAVEDARPLLSGGDQARLTQHLEMVRGIGEPHPRALTQSLDAPFALREEVEQLDPFGVRNRPAETGELLVESVLRLPPVHLHHLLHYYRSIWNTSTSELARRGGTMPRIHALVDEGLGNSSYVVDLGEGSALVVDPSRDPAPYLEAAKAHGLRIAFAAETHLHADFISGSVELATRGATVLGSALGGREFPHQGLTDADEIDLGGLTLRAIATPGHTPEHLAYLLLDGPRPVALFTGGSLIVGAVARTDLVSPERTEELARAAYRSVRERLLTLPDDLPVYPTHGAGSFCSAPASTERTTTIGSERATNPLLAAADEDTFVARLLGGLGTYPPYFLRLQDVNRRGPQVYGGLPLLTPLSPERVRLLAGDDAEIVDVRPAGDFAMDHIPGALSIPLRPVFGTWLGWVVPPRRPIVFVVGDGQDRAELVRQALTVGYEDLAGELAGGMEAWRGAGYEVRRIAHVDAADLGDVPATPVVDVRQLGEYEAGHIPGALNVELGSLSEAGDLPEGPLIVMCGHGERAMTGASLLERSGREDLTVVVGGPDGWVAPGRSLQVGA